MLSGQSCNASIMVDLPLLTLESKPARQRAACASLLRRPRRPERPEESCPYGGYDPVQTIALPASPSALSASVQLAAFAIVNTQPAELTSSCGPAMPGEFV